MKIYKRFPIQDFVEVPCAGGVLKVKYKFPTTAQARMIAEESSVGGHALAVCQFCVEEIQGLESEEGEITMQAVEKRTGAELTLDQVLILFNAGLTIPIYAVYAEKLAPTETDKKKSE